MVCMSQVQPNKKPVLIGGHIGNREFQQSDSYPHLDRVELKDLLAKPSHSSQSLTGIQQTVRCAPLKRAEVGKSALFTGASERAWRGVNIPPFCLERRPSGSVTFR
jgi:hypothetical protein